ncbi:MAG: radical SAM family heme chaperone HemW [Oscillospiraceae bacterium]|nr:radical SAM family heme chaperone HemW [Oscillospiraceae bacterium]
MAKQKLTFQTKSLGIYVHIPFCRSKCQYCDFYSMPRDDKTQEYMDRYVKALEMHIREGGARAPKYEVDTVYFGGGTPSYFGAERLRQVYQCIAKRFNVSKNAEVTLEANPDTVTEKGCKRLIASGFNRISIGVQTNDDATLKVLGRPHTFKQAVKAVNIARDAGFDNVSLDLMFGLPAQTPQMWADALGSIIDLHPDHISCYGLTLNVGTPLYYYRNQAMLPDDDAQAAMYLYAVSTLEAYGYRQYEISNFAKNGRECMHNLKYWLGGEYMSFGPSASSDFAGTRYTFASNLPQYIKAVTTGDAITTECEYVPIKERAGEYIMLRMRTIYGIEREEYEKTFLMPFDPLEQLLKFYGSRGLAKLADGRWYFTPQGMLVSNQLIGQLIEAQTKSTPLSPHRF